MPPFSFLFSLAMVTGRRDFKIWISFRTSFRTSYHNDMWNHSESLACEFVCRKMLLISEVFQAFQASTLATRVEPEMDRSRGASRSRVGVSNVRH